MGWQRESVTARMEFALSIDQMVANGLPSMRIRINPSLDGLWCPLVGLRL